MPRRIISGTRMKRFPTRDFNEAVAAAQDRYRREVRQGGAALGGIVKIRNDSGADIDAGDPLGIDGLMVEHADNEPEFRLMPGYLGVEPDALEHGLKWVIADEPISDGQIGRAVYRGLCVVEVDVRNEYHTHARFRTDGDTDAVQLWSDFGGLAQIVAKPDGTGDAWCQVDMRADSSWWVEGYLTGTLNAATIVAGKVEPETVGVRIWNRDALGNIATDTEDEIEAYNSSEFTSGLEDFYARCRFDGTFWRLDAIDCDASGLPGASG